jgi:hypothetical protein
VEADVVGGGVEAARDVGGGVVQQSCCGRHHESGIPPNKGCIVVEFFLHYIEFLFLMSRAGLGRQDTSQTVNDLSVDEASKRWPHLDQQTLVIGAV